MTNETTPQTTVDDEPTVAEGKFQSFADWISQAIGSPANIVIWLLLVIAWISLFAFGGPKLATGYWLPAWFTSQGFNFPLNLVTTVVELFIGFLVATAANRSQRALTALLAKIETQEAQISDVEKNLAEQLQQNTDLTREVHALAEVIRDVVQMTSPTS